MNQHPILNQNYQNFINRVTNLLNEENLGELQHTHTDFHSNTLLNDRGNTAYIAIHSNHVVSPIYFNVTQANNYTIDHPSYPIIAVPHRII